MKQGSLARSGYVEFKCDSNFLANYTKDGGTKVKERKDKRHRQLLYVKKYMSNSCIINYNNKVQVVEEYVWSNSSCFGVNSHQINGSLSPSRLVLLSTCTLKDLNIKSLESMMNE